MFDEGPAHEELDLLGATVPFDGEAMEKVAGFGDMSN
jgi:hypothetical protein